MKIFAIDPGTTESGYCIYEDARVTESGVLPNDEMLKRISWGDELSIRGYRLCLEMIASYGMAVGREVFETCVWIGRFKQAWHDPSAVELVYRKEVKMHLCGTHQAKDPNVRQALLDLFPRTGGGKTPQIGTKGQPGPLYGVSSHAWPALGVAITAAAKHQLKGAA